MDEDGFKGRLCRPFLFFKFCGVIKIF